MAAEANRQAVKGGMREGDCGKSAKRTGYMYEYVSSAVVD